MQTSIIHKIFFLLVLTCILNSFAYAQKKAEQIHELLAHYHMLGRHHGAVLVAQDGEVIYEGGFGLADATWGISNSPDVKYGIGSVTKMFTALLVMQQIERGALHLEAPAANYLPDFPAPIDERITVEQLLTHRSGRLLTHEYQSIMNTPHVEDDWIGDDYGPGLQHFYGYGVETHRRAGSSLSDSVTVVGHGGGYTGWSTIFWRIPEDGIILAVLNNQHIPPLYIELFDIMYERPYHLPTEEELSAREER